MSSAIKEIHAHESPVDPSRETTANMAEIDALLRRADEARDDKLWTIAAEAYSAVLELAPERAPIWVQYGHMLKEAGKRDEALGAYEKALEFEPGNADTHLQLGHLFKLLENKTRAVEMYRRALEIDPMLVDAAAELKRLGVRARSGNLVRSGKTPSQKPVLYFDVTDLLVYFRENRTPTGIQRISVAVTEAALADSRGRDIALCAVDTESGSWKPVDPNAYKFAMMLAREGADNSDEPWQRAIDKLHSDLSAAPALAFPTGSTILNLGSPWGVSNYFVAVREAKRQYGVSYVAFVHDTIPLLLPEFCEGTTTNVYTRWIAGVSLHADLVLANAQNTKKDFVKAIARFSGRPVDCEVVNPNGDFSLLMMEDAPAISQDVQALLQARYALFVGTIEPRKNHLMVLSAWRRLLAEEGGARVPVLVFAGKMGWHSEHVVDFIRKTDYLDGKLKVLNDASDADLEALYQNAAFTIYNSHYEGWGLPVTESLSYGKVPVIARNSALTESGGKHAIFFDSNSEASLLKVVKNLVKNPEVLAKQEKLIASQSPVRPWDAIYGDIEEAITRKLAKPERPAARIGVIDLGKIYWLGTDRAMRNPADFARCEAVRAGNGWHTPEEWGGWTARRSFQMMFDIDFGGAPDDGEDILLHIQFRGHRENAKVRVELGGESSQAFVVHADRDTVLRVSFKRSQIPKMPVVFSGEQSTMTSLAKLTEGRDTRSIGVGVKAFMVCREGDVLSRLRFMEEAGLGYAAAVAGVTDMIHSDVGSLSESLSIPETVSPAPDSGGG
jgi:glycosyltransferase involved in cell wall biosynthesis